MEKIDSELLTILRSLVMTGSQTKTALSLSKSQSTISRTLSRARTLFHDPLFVHNGSMLVPTNRMLEIYGHLPKLLGEMEALFAKEIFHPESLNLHLRVAAIDYAAQYIILPAFHAMKRIAPRISIELQQLNADTFRRLSLGSLKSSKAPTNYFTPNILRKSWSRLVVSVVHLDALAFPVAAT